MTYLNNVLKEERQEADIADFKFYLRNYGSALDQEAQDALINSIKISNDKVSIKSLNQLVDLYNFIPVTV